MDGVHVVDECFHGLVHAAYRAVDRVLSQPLISLKSFKGEAQVVVEFGILDMGKVGR